MMRWVAALVLAVTAACSGSAAPRPVTPSVTAPKDADPDGPNRAAIAAQIQPMIDAELTAGMVVGIYDAGRMEIYGFGKGPGGKPPTGHTLFELGSVTGVYTSLLLADSVQRREVDLDTPVAELLPPGVTVPTADKVPITLRHLSVNSSGLPRTPPSLAHATTENPFAKYDENALYRDLVHTTLEAPPGSRILYSELGVGLLGFVLGKKVGGYTQAVQSRILGPLGLHETFFSVPAADAARFAQGTNDDLATVPHWQFDALAGAGGLISTAHDQLLFLDAELDAAAGGHKTLRPAMHLTQESQLETQGANEGLGWNIDSAGRYWQVGGTGGFRSFIGFDPKTKHGVVLLASSSISLIDALAKRIYDVLAGQPVPVPKFPDATQLALFAGTYDFQGMKLVMKVQGKRIYVEGPGEPRIRMLPISDHEFWIESLQSVCVFEQKDGKVSRAIFVLGERQMSAPRIE